MRILLIEDDPMIGESVRDGLRVEHYAVDWVQDGEVAEQVLARQGYDLIVLDLGLPRKDGMEVLNAYRRRGGDAPVLVMTARGDVADRIRGLDTGADDYLVKPFDIDELYARVRALLRRRLRPEVQAQAAGRGLPLPPRPSDPVAPKAQPFGPPGTQPSAQPGRQRSAPPGAATIECRGLVLKRETGEITFKGSPLRLSGREYAVLRALLDPPGVVVTRERIEALLVKADPTAAGSVDREVFMLRSKFGSDFIRNVSGAGYMIVSGR